jgi:putative transposase
MPVENDLIIKEERGLRPLPIFQAPIGLQNSKIGRGRKPRSPPKNIMAERLNSPDSEGVLHFVTLNVRDRKAAFRRPAYATMVLQELRFECDRHPAILAAYVVMPDHLHFLLGPQDGELKRFLARFKPGVTLKLDALASQNGRTKEREWLAQKGKRELWQDSKYSLPVYSPQWIRRRWTTFTVIWSERV